MILCKGVRVYENNQLELVTSKLLNRGTLIFVYNFLFAFKKILYLCAAGRVVKRKKLKLINKYL